MYGKKKKKKVWIKRDRNAKMKTTTKCKSENETEMQKPKQNPKEDENKNKMQETKMNVTWWEGIKKSNQVWKKSSEKEGKDERADTKNPKVMEII